MVLVGVVLGPVFVKHFCISIRTKSLMAAVGWGVTSVLDCPRGHQREGGDGRCTPQEMCSARDLL